MCRHPAEAAFRQHRVEAGKQPGQRARARQLLAVKPDRLGIGHSLVQRQSREAHERQPIAQLVLGLLVRQRVEPLQHKGAEHQHRVVGRPATAAAIRARQRRLKLRTERLEVHHGAQPLQRVARGRQPPQSLLRVEEAPLSRHAAPPPSPAEANQNRPRRRRGFFEGSDCLLTASKNTLVRACVVGATAISCLDVPASLIEPRHGSKFRCRFLQHDIVQSFTTEGEKGNRPPRVRGKLAHRLMHAEDTEALPCDNIPPGLTRGQAASMSRRTAA